MPDSRQAKILLEERLRGPRKVSEIVIVHSDEFTVDDPRFRAAVQSLYGDVILLGTDVIESGVNYYMVPDNSMVSDNRHTTLMPFVMAGSLDTADSNVAKLLGVVEQHNITDGFEVLETGKSSIGRDFQQIASQDLKVSETIGAIAALLILLIVFGAVVAAGIPIALAVASIVVAIGITAITGQFFTYEFFVVNMITMMGLAVGIDYSLFIVSRYREERLRGHDKIDAITITGATASRAVLFSGMMVLLALSGMMVIPSTVFTSLGAGAIYVVAISVLAALTLLPAILGLLGDRINALRIPFIRRRDVGVVGKRGGFWDRVAQTVMRRPIISLLLAVGLLSACTIPYFSIRTGSSGVSTLPDKLQSKKAFKMLESEFSSGLISPVEIVINGDVGSPEVQQAVRKLKSFLAQDKSFFGEQVLTPNQNADLALLSAPVSGDPNSEESKNVINKLRNQYIPRSFNGVDAKVYVGGEAAINVDLVDMTDSYRPIVFAFVLGLSFVLLTAVFHSLIVPLKAIIMNLLSVGAAYGLVVLVFQEGVGASLFGFQQVSTVETWLPLFLFSILFGLSMDYHVFLLSRIRERYMQTGDNSESVAFGLRSTGAIITGAAIIMVAVFGSFASGSLTIFQQIGFGLAVAVLMDATIVRTVLVPAAMELLGDKNWYLPGWLEWLPDFHIDSDKTVDAADKKSPDGG
ncbi:MAG: MMPL family transporter [Thermoleophilia bacterium]